MPTTDYREIPLTNGQVAKVSSHRYEELSRYKWYARWCKYTRGYRALRNDYSGGKQTTILMHREVLGLKYGDKRQADHINHDTLDNTDENLRITDHHGQSGNKFKYRNNTSGFRGVSKHGKKWQAAIHTPSGHIYLGARDTAEAAYMELYVPAALKYFGEFAHITPIESKAQTSLSES